MRTFTREEIEKLSCQELNFTRAVKCSYKSATNSKTDQMIYEIYVDATGDKSLSANWSCSYCSYKLYRKCGEKYLKEKDLYKVIDLDELEPSTEVVETEQVKNKRGRKATNKN